MLCIESNTGAYIVNLKNLYKNGIWGGMIINNKDCNICKCEVGGITDFIINYCVKYLIDNNNNLALNILSSLDRTYFLIRPDDKHTRRYYIKKNINCKESDIKRGRKQGFYFMGVIVLRDDLHLNKNKAVIIDWIESYYRKADTATTIIDLLEQRYKINLIPTNIRPAPNYWKKYLKKNDKVYNFNMFINYLWNKSKNITNYYEIAYDVEGYYKIYDVDEEYIYLKLLYDY